MSYCTVTPKPTPDNPLRALVTTPNGGPRAVFSTPEDARLYLEHPGGLPPLAATYLETVEAPAPAETVPPRPTLQDEAERLLSYWETHGDNPEVVSKWAVEDMLGILRYIVEEGK